MFQRMKDRNFSREALRILGDEFAETLGDGVGDDCFALCCGALDGAVKTGEIPANFLQAVARDVRKRNARPADAAIAYLDAAITFVKAISRDILRANPEYRPLTDMERVLDTMFLKFQSPIVPRNGRAGPAMADFTTER